jgi:hypothetical protein
MQVHAKLVRCADGLKLLGEENKLVDAFCVIMIMLQDIVTLNNYIKFSGKLLNQFVARQTGIALVTITLSYKNETIYGTFA